MSQLKTDRSPGPAPSLQDASAAGDGELVAGRCYDAVNRAEALLCGPGAVATIAAAQGVVAAGGRAAVLLSAATRRPTLTPSIPSGTWLGHRRRTRDAGMRTAVGFELLAADAQAAVDHCLVGHRLVRHLGQPGLCVVDPEVAEALALAWLPDAEATAFLDEGLEAGGATYALAAVRRAFADVAAFTGRACQPVSVHGPADAPYAIAAAGGAVGIARAAAEQLAGEGVECRVIDISILHPAPEEELRAALDGAQAVAVADLHGNVAGEIDLARVVRSALWDRSDCPVHALVRLPTETADLADTLQTIFGLERLPTPPPARAKKAVSVALGTAPAGPWGEALLLAAAALLGRQLPGLWLGETADGDGLVLAHEPVVRSDLDVLVVADPAAPRGELAARMREDGLQLVVGGSGVDRRVRQPRRRWLPDLEVAGPSAADDRYDHILGALLTVPEGLRRLLPDDAVDVAQLEGVSPEQAERLRAGGQAVQDLHEEAPAAVVSQQPVMPTRDPTVGLDPAWRQALRRFHLSGEGAWSTAEPNGALPLRPWALPESVAPRGQWRQFPIVVGEQTLPLAEWIRSRLGSESGLKDHVEHLCAAIAAGVEGPTLLTGAFAAAHERMLVPAAPDEPEVRALEEELNALQAALPQDALIVGLNGHTLIDLLALAASRSRREQVLAFRQQVMRLAQRLEERLQLDSSHTDQAREPASLAASLGGAVQLDIESLSRKLPQHRGSQRLGAEREARIRRALATLQEYLAASKAEQPDLVLLAPPHLAAPERLPSGVSYIAHEAGLEAAPGYFEAAARRLVDLFRAVRIARLEIDDAWQSQHAQILRRLDWQALTPEELGLVPTVLVLETANRVLAGALSAFSDLLRSGRPLQLVVVDEVSGSPGGRSLADPPPAVGSLAMAHRDALVVQSSLARPTHLLKALEDVVCSLRPSVAVVAVPDWRTAVPAWLQVAAALEGRRSPCFRYDPGAGRSWDERFDMAVNPAPEDDWPVVEVTRSTPDGGETSRREAFTFAHAACLSAAWRRAFRVVPASAWGSDQVELTAWLDMDPEERLRRIPYIWVVGNYGTLARAVMTRDMAFACDDHLDEWRMVQDWVQPHNLPAREAAAQPTQEAPEQQFARGRTAALSEAMARLQRTLLGLDPESPLPAAAAAKPAVDEVEAATGAPAAIAAPAASGPGDLVGEPSIDSVLCSSCHDCINLNGRMFQYNGNKQAFIADPLAGTFEQLVKAAEKCPSRCIYPGAPRDDDATVTAKLIERARRFA